MARRSQRLAQMSKESCAKTEDNSFPKISKPASQKGKRTKSKKKDAVVPRKRAKVEPDNGDAKLEEMTISQNESDSDSWEDVPETSENLDLDNLPSTSAAAVAKKTVEVHIESPATVKGKQTLIRELNRHRREYQANLHKVHLLCLVAHSRFVSGLCNDETLKAVLLSLIPSGFVNASNLAFDAPVLHRFLLWFISAFPGGSAAEGLEVTPDAILRAAEAKAPPTHQFRAIILVAALRSLGLDVRLVSSINPVPLKPDTAESSTSSKKTTKKKETVQKVKAKRGSAKKVQAKAVLESDHEIEVPVNSEKVKNVNRCNHWAEVYLDSEERWIVVDPVSSNVDNPTEMVRHCMQPVTYIIGVDNDQCLKDVTSRYVQLSASMARQCRVDSVWWRQTLRPFRSPHSRRDRAEDLLLHDDFCQGALPTTLTEFKQHPLYVLEKDLRKYEAIYPRDVAPVGTFRGLKVFQRNAVYELHSKEHWLKSARSIRVDEEPYKVVKGRAKPQRKGGLEPSHATGATPGSDAPASSEASGIERPLPLYGFWQTEPYMAPPATDGKVPRNEFGNVYLFKPSMLPPGTVHLPVPNLMPLARKLGIDCAEAIIGWEFFGRGSHPVFDGVVVCEENAEMLMDAWDLEQSRLAGKLDLERKKRAVRNWVRFTKGLLIRESIKQRFKLPETGTSGATALAESKRLESDSDSDDNEQVNRQAFEKAQLAWPQNKRDFSLNEFK